MRMVGKIIGYSLWIGCGLLMYIFWISAMSKWLGILGFIIALVIAPGVVIFPIVFWIVEKVFPVFYFIIWGIGIVGLIIAGLSSSYEKTEHTDIKDLFTDL